MTDGCGLSSKNIHVSLSHMFSLSSTPAAFQFRLAGCKVTQALSMLYIISNPEV